MKKGKIVSASKDKCKEKSRELSKEHGKNEISVKKITAIQRKFSCINKNFRYSFFFAEKGIKLFFIQRLQFSFHPAAVSSQSEPSLPKGVCCSFLPSP